MQTQNKIGTLLGICGLLCIAALGGCGATRTQRVSAAPSSTKPLELTTLGAGDQLGVSLYEHYVMVATLRGETKAIALTSAR